MLSCFVVVGIRGVVATVDVDLVVGDVAAVVASAVAAVPMAPVVRNVRLCMRLSSNRQLRPWNRHLSRHGQIRAYSYYVNT